MAQYTKQCKLKGMCGTGANATTIFVGTPSSAVNYDNYLRASDDRIHMVANGTNLLTMNYDATGVWSTSWRAEYGEESYHYQDDVPGTASSKTRFNYLEKYNSSGGLSFFSKLTAAAPRTARYHLGALADANVGGLKFNAWTDPL